MTKNMGSIDRPCGPSSVLCSSRWAATGTVGWWGYIGIVPLVTAIVGICPAYLPFGIKTCKRGDDNAKHA